MSPDEIVFRRINAKQTWWIKPDGTVAPDAFVPNKGDVDGLSLVRAASAEEAARLGIKGKRFHAVPLKVGDMTGMTVIGDSDTHALVVGMTYANFDSVETQGRAAKLSKVCGRASAAIEGAGDPPPKPAA